MLIAPMLGQVCLVRASGVALRTGQKLPCASFHVLVCRVLHHVAALAVLMPAPCHRALERNGAVRCLNLLRRRMAELDGSGKEEGLHRRHIEACVKLIHVDAGDLGCRFPADLRRHRFIRMPHHQIFDFVSRVGRCVDSGDVRDAPSGLFQLFFVSIVGAGVQAEGCTFAVSLALQRCHAHSLGEVKFLHLDTTDGALELSGERDHGVDTLSANDSTGTVEASALQSA